MAKFKLTLEYDGSRYSGWQLQKNERSVQGELIQAASKIFDDQPVEVYGAGRTDSGVHARGQVAHLEVGETRLSPEQIKMSLNDELGHAINILMVEKPILNSMPGMMPAVEVTPTRSLKDAMLLVKSMCGGCGTLSILAPCETQRPAWKGFMTSDPLAPLKKKVAVPSWILIT